MRAVSILQLCSVQQSHRDFFYLLLQASTDLGNEDASPLSWPACLWWPWLWRSWWWFRPCPGLSLMQSQEQHRRQKAIRSRFSGGEDGTTAPISTIITTPTMVMGTTGAEVQWQTSRGKRWPHNFPKGFTPSSTVAAGWSIIIDFSFPCWWCQFL